MWPNDAWHHLARFPRKMQSSRYVEFTSPATEGKPRQEECTLRIGNRPVRADLIVPRAATAALDHRDLHRLALIEHHACASILPVRACPRLDGTPHGRYKGHPLNRISLKYGRCIQSRVACAASDIAPDHVRCRRRHSVDNPNLAVIRKLRRLGVDVAVCGQSVVAHGYGVEDLDARADRGAVLAHHRRGVAAPRLHPWCRCERTRAVMAHALIHLTPCRGSAH